MHWRTCSLFVALAAALPACGYDNDGGRSEPLPVAEAPIDADIKLVDIKPGEGVGAFVEYASDGRWHVFTACDSQVAGQAVGETCFWDIVVSVAQGSTISRLEADALEAGEDHIYAERGAAELAAFTSADLDGLYFYTTPGETVRVDVWLDDRPAPEFIFWSGLGAVNLGAPTNPIDLTPRLP